MIQIGTSNIPLVILMLSFVGLWNILGIPPIIKGKKLNDKSPTRRS